MKTKSRVPFAPYVVALAMLAVPFLGVGCEGTAIDGGSNGPSVNGSSSSPPVDVRNTIFGRFSLRSLTKSASAEGTEVAPASIGVTFEITLTESGVYELDDGTTCIRGRYTFASAESGDRAAFSFSPRIVRDGVHAVEFRDNQLAVADLVQGHPWGRLVPTNARSRCSL